MLALHLHERRADPPQQADAHRLVVDEGAGATVRLHHAAQHDLFLGRLDSLLAQHVEHRMPLGRQEAGRDRRLPLAGAHHAGLGAGVEHFLAKPAPMSRLLEVVRRALDYSAKS